MSYVKLVRRMFVVALHKSVVAASRIFVVASKIEKAHCMFVVVARSFVVVASRPFVAASRIE